MVNIGPIVEQLIKMTWFYSGLFLLIISLLLVVLSWRKGKITNLKLLIIIVLAVLIIVRDCIIYIYAIGEEKTAEEYIAQASLFRNRLPSSLYKNESFAEGDWVEISKTHDIADKCKGIIIFIDKNQNIELIDDVSKKRIAINLDQISIRKLSDNRKPQGSTWGAAGLAILPSLFNNKDNVSTDKNTNNINTTSPDSTLKVEH